MERKIEFDEFCSRVLRALGNDWVGDPARSTGLFDDIGLDSLEGFELLVIVETLAELMVPLPDLPVIFTLGDAFDYYEAAWQAAQSDELR